MMCGRRSALQLEHIDAFFGFFAWCERLEHLRALEVRLRGTAIIRPILYKEKFIVYVEVLFCLSLDPEKERNLKWINICLHTSAQGSFLRYIL